MSDIHCNIFLMFLFRRSVNLISGHECTGCPFINHLLIRIVSTLLSLSRWKEVSASTSMGMASLRAPNQLLLLNRTLHLATRKFSNGSSYLSISFPFSHQEWNRCG